MGSITLFWFRRDLRLDDNHGLYKALSLHGTVLPVFIFDENILSKLNRSEDARINFIYEELLNLKQGVESAGGTLHVRYGDPVAVFERLLQEFRVEAVHTNDDYEPMAVERDKRVEHVLRARNIPFYRWKDQVIFEKSEIARDDGEPYAVFTPYYKRWRAMLDERPPECFPSEKLSAHYHPTKPVEMPALGVIGFERLHREYPPASINEEIVRNYDKTRDIPSIQGTSRLGLHLRFGKVSIRKMIRKALDLNETWLRELAWREFYMMILWHHPRVVDRAFKPAYDRINWRNNEADFGAWCDGCTGYPFVDAGMRELNRTGYMHNRLRMVTASFLTKHLLVDWRWGEAYFAGKLLDYEVSSNNGGWQWAAGSGCDAAPYFRIFNPSLQQRKFDAAGEYTRRWIPELDTSSYPKPLVDHARARQRAIGEFRKALGTTA